MNDAEDNFGEIRESEHWSDVGGRSNVNIRHIAKGRIKNGAGPAYEEQRRLAGDGKTLTITITAAQCAGCGSLFEAKGPKSLGGACAFCGEAMCKECMAERTCHFCGKRSCDSDGYYRTLDYTPYYMCARHP